MADRPAWLTSYMPALIRQGLSPTAALRQLRASESEGGLGLSVRTQTWYQAWGETIAWLGRQQQIARVPMGRAPTVDEITRMPSRTATGLFYPADVLVRNRATGETYYTPSGFKSQRPVTYQTAMQGAIDHMTNAAFEGSPSAMNLQILGVLPLPVIEYVPGG